VCLHRALSYSYPTLVSVTVPSCHFALTCLRFLWRFSGAKLSSLQNEALYWISHRSMQRNGPPSGFLEVRRKYDASFRERWTKWHLWT
jgi:hypothetical protein